MASAMMTTRNQVLIFSIAYYLSHMLLEAPRNSYYGLTASYDRCPAPFPAQTSPSAPSECHDSQSQYRTVKRHHGRRTNCFDKLTAYRYANECGKRGNKIRRAIISAELICPAQLSDTCGNLQTLVNCLTINVTQCK